MSDPTAQEPTMEEILASIRRIISEDDAPAAPEAAAAPPPAPAPTPEPPPAPILVRSAPEPEPAPEEEEDVLELNEPAPAPRETHGDLDVFETPKPAPPAPEPKVEMASIKMADPQPEPAYAPIENPYKREPTPPAGGGLVSGSAASAAASHFGLLAQSIAMPAAGRTLEDVVGELLRPLLKDWLDEHLPGLVEQAVRDEVERISRRRV